MAVQVERLRLHQLGLLRQLGLLNQQQARRFLLAP
jgi:hypothetical protein